MVRARRAVPQKFGVKINLGIVELSGEWEPNDVERRAAWELYVELITRVSTVPLADDEGLLTEALHSLYSLFGTTREILRRSGPSVAETKILGQFNFAFLAVTILNSGLRPTLARWHPVLAEWEAGRPAGVSMAVHEAAWPEATQLRKELGQIRVALADYARALATACGIPNLLED